MAESITYSISARVADGPELVKSAILSVEAYDVINATIEKTTGPTTINLQPSGVGEISLLYITSDLYEDLEYTVDSEVTPIILDKPQMYLGAGQIGLLGPTCLALIFTNASATTDANIRILVGRAAEAP